MHAFIAPRERQYQILLLGVIKVKSVICAGNEEFVKKDLALIFRHGLRFQIVDEGFPVFGDLFEHLTEKFDNLVAVHFFVKCAEVRIHGCGGPASLMLAAGDAQIGCLIPAEELTFSGMNFGTYCGLEVLVTDLTVFVRIEFVEKFHEPFIFHFDAPMFHIVAELMWLDCASLF